MEIIRPEVNAAITITQMESLEVTKGVVVVVVVVVGVPSNGANVVVVTSAEQNTVGDS